MTWLIGFALDPGAIAQRRRGDAACLAAAGQDVTVHHQLAPAAAARGPVEDGVRGWWKPLDEPLRGRLFGRRASATAGCRPRLGLPRAPPAPSAPIHRLVLLHQRGVSGVYIYR